MGFHTALRRAGNSQLPHYQRVRSLAHAIEKFYGLSFTGAFEQLHRATGSSNHEWTPEQLDAAVELVGRAHRSWSAFYGEASDAARQAKHQKGYSVRQAHEVFARWMEAYFDDDVRSLWKLEPENSIELLLAHRRHQYLRENAS